MRSLTAVLLALTACGTEPSTGSQDPINTQPDAGTTGTMTSPDGGVSSAPGDGGTATVTDCDEARDHSDLAWIQQKIFNVSCITGCHSGAYASAHMDLSDGRAWTSLVNVPSNQYSGWVRVVPGDPASSFLLVELRGEPGPTLDNYMPWGQPALCTEKVDAIKRWITAGAPQ